MSAHPSSSTQMQEGKIEFPYGGETFQTYYKVYGDIATNSKRPLILLHGGPGFVHNYLLPHVTLATKYDIPVIFYDQIGNGKSTHLRGRGAEFLTVDLFCAELENLIKHFGIQDGFDILGHSWGGILSSEFSVRKQLPGLKHLILANSLAAFNLWTQSVVELLQPFPEEIKQTLLGASADPKRYKSALLEFHAVHGCTVKPFPEEYLYTIDQVFGPDGDSTISTALVLQNCNWSIIDRLHQITVPTFVIHGRKDIAQDFVVKPFFEKIQKVKWVTLENSSHTPAFEEHDRYMELVADFLAL